MSEQSKKPIFKKWWFWVITAVVFGLIGIVNGGEEKADPVAIAASPEVQTSNGSESAKKTDVETSVEKAQLPEYEVVEDRLDKSGMWYLTLSTASDDEKELEELVRNASILASEKEVKVESLFVFIIKKNSESSAYIATGKMAFTSKGEAQTGLEKGAVEFEFNG